MGDSEDEDGDKKRPEKVADQKPGKSAKKKEQKKFRTSEVSRSDDEYEPKTADEEIPIEANSSRTSARYVVAQDELGGEVANSPPRTCLTLSLLIVSMAKPPKMSLHLKQIR